MLEQAFGGARENSTFRDLCSFTVRTHGQRLDRPGVAVTETPGVHATVRTSVCGKTKKNTQQTCVKVQLSLIINKSRLTSNAILHNNLQEASQLLSSLYPTNIQPVFFQKTHQMLQLDAGVSQNYTRLA